MIRSSGFLELVSIWKENLRVKISGQAVETHGRQGVEDKFCPWQPTLGCISFGVTGCVLQDLCPTSLELMPSFFGIAEITSRLHSGSRVWGIKLLKAGGISYVGWHFLSLKDSDFKGQRVSWIIKDITIMKGSGNGLVASRRIRGQSCRDPMSPGAEGNHPGVENATKTEADERPGRCQHGEIREGGELGFPVTASESSE